MFFIKKPVEIARYPPFQNHLAVTQSPSNGQPEPTPLPAPRAKVVTMNTQDQDPQLKIVSSLVESTLTKAFAEMSGTPPNEPKPAQRIMDVEVAKQGHKLKIASDGLNLDQKIHIERQLYHNFSNAGIPLQSVSFARTAAGSTGVTGDRPQPAKPKVNAFGLNIEKKAIPGVRHVVIVASGKGGVGKSTVSTNLAVALNARGLRVGLMDCDVYGPSAPLLLGVRGQIEVGSGGKLIPREGHGVKVVSFGFLSDVRSPVIWRGPLVSKAIEQLCYDVAWGDLDVLVVDMPPGTGDVQLTIAEKLPIHGAVIVTTPQDVALIDAHKAVSMFERLEVPVLGVVENMAWHECSRCGHKDHIFGEDAFQEFLTSRKLKLLTRIPLRKEIRIASDNGNPAALSASEEISGSYKSLATAVVEELLL